MAASIPLPIAEYLNTTYRPDREYVDGVVVERNVGEWEHGRVQALLAGWFGRYERVWEIQTAIAWRTRVSSTRVRIPDVVLVRPGVKPDVLDTAALLVVEKLSPHDTYSNTQERANNLKTRTAWICAGHNWTLSNRLEVAGTPIYVELQHLFAPLDQPGASQ